MVHIREALQEELRGITHPLLSPANDTSCPTLPAMTTAEAARYCGFKSTAAIRKALRDGRLIPIGRRGGTGTYMWSRPALDAFLAGARSGIVPPGRPGANPAQVGGTHGNEMGQAMGQLDSTGAGQTRRLPQEGGGISGPGRVTDPRTGKQREIRLNLLRVDALGAYNRLQDELAMVRDGLKQKVRPRRIRFTEFAASLFEHKLKTGRVKSAKSRQKWESVIRLHLAPVFGDLFVDAIRRTDIKAWKESMGEMIEAGELHPNTANDRLALLGRILGAAAVDFEWERNPMTGIDRFDTSEHRTYTEEEPNSLTVEEVRRFLAALKGAFPQHFAMTALGFATGLRPSSLRPLRRCGLLADVKWDESVLLVRRSQTVGDEVMETTKTKKRQKLFLPTELFLPSSWTSCAGTSITRSLRPSRPRPTSSSRPRREDSGRPRP